MTLLLSKYVSASATSADFEICKKEAIKVLEHCLSEHQGNDNSIYQCWPDNEQRYRDCVHRVLETYSPSAEQLRFMQEKKAAAEKAMAELEAKRQSGNH